MFKVESDILKQAVGFVAGIVLKGKDASPVLQNTKITFDSNGLRFETTNTDISCLYTVQRSFVDSKSASFSTTVPALKFNDILKKIGNEKISCKFLRSSDKEVFVLKTAKSKFLLDCLPSNIYPSSRNLEYSSNFSIKASDLLDAINRVKFSVCTDEARFYINGILLDMSGKNTLGQDALNIVSTDSHRLSIQSVISNVLKGEISQIILPRRSIQKVVDILALAREEEIFIEINKTKIRFSFGGCSVSSNLIEGEFPQYQRVIPQNTSSHAIIEKSELQKAVNSVSAIFSGSAYNVVKLKFVNSTLVVEASRSNKNLGSDIGIAKYDMSCESNFAEPFVVSYNFSYLMECLSAVDSKYCKFNFTEPTKPCLVTPDYSLQAEPQPKESEDKKQTTHSDYKFVIMPIRV